jgi:gamma-glutamyltranspeptidase/glutathione hydrolase
MISRGGELYKEGDTLRLPDLAATLRRIQRDGRDGFYRGETSEMIIREMERGGGLISHADMEAYEPAIRVPVEGTYRGFTVIGPPLPSSGGICLVEFLNILEKFDLARSGYHSSRTVHLETEAMKCVFADRSAYLGDPGFSRAPVERLVSKQYGAAFAAKIDTLHDMPSSRFATDASGRGEGPQTTHYAVVDEARTVVSVTFTLNDLFGCKVVPQGAGFFLNDDIDDFSVSPGTPNLYGLTGSAANALAPRKCPLSSMSPTIVLKDGNPLFTLGARGGPKIITAVAQTILNVVDFGMNIQEAVDAPRFHHQWLPDTLEYDKYCFPADVMINLSAMGHRMKEADDYLGRLEAIGIDPDRSGWLYGAPDPREEGEAAGY